MENRAEASHSHARWQRHAVIDVGTNSVKLLVGDIRGHELVPVAERAEQSRLGEGFFETRSLQPAAIERTADAIARFYGEANALGALSIRILATAAAREALNVDDLAAAVHARTRSRLEIIHGSTEADMAFRGVCSTPGLPCGPVLVTDVGGGSTEFIVGHEGGRSFGRSYPIGAVRLLESLQPPPNPSAADRDRCRDAVDRFLSEHVINDVAPAIRSAGIGCIPLRYLGVGGTAVILARIANGLTHFDRDLIEATRLSTAEVSAWVDQLWSLPLEERRRVPGLPPERADVILTGAVVYERILLTFGLDAVSPSTRGLRFAALLEAHQDP